MEKKSKYIDYGQDIASVCGSDIHKILRTIAFRYIGQNPQNPFGFHVFHKDGFLSHPDGRYNLNLDEKLEETKLGEVSYICTQFWKETSGSQSFLVSCYGPVIIYMNGKMSYRSTVREDVNVQIQKTIEISYQPGWNVMVIKCTKAASGFGCIIGAYEPNWNWVSFMTPFNERKGQLGFVYSEALEDSEETDSVLISLKVSMSEEITRFQWFPKREWDKEIPSQFALERIYGICMGETACGWSSVYQTNRSQPAVQIKLKTCGLTEVYIDGVKILSTEQDTVTNIELEYGSHSILVTCQCRNREHWGFTLEFLTAEDKQLPFQLPCNVLGTKDPWLYLGTLNLGEIDPEKIQTLYKLFGNENKRYWQIDEPNAHVRPVLENQGFGRWNYPLGVTLYGLMATARILGSNEMIQYVTAHIEECVRMYEYSLWDSEQYGFPEINNQLVGLKMLDDCGSFGSAMLELHDTSLEQYTKPIAVQIANHMLHLQERQPDGAYYRRCTGHYMENTLWVDDLYMSVPFLCRYYQLSGDAVYLEDAINQFVQFQKYLFIPEQQVMSHVYDFKYNTATKMPWGRGNGWCFFSLSELLEILPKEHIKRGELLNFFNQLAEGYLLLQGAEGLWHQLLTHPDSYEESSCTAMFVYALCRGIRFGWLNDDLLGRALDAVYKGWNGLTKKAIDRHGNIHGVCRGSAYSFSPRYYKEELLWITNDPHGIGIVLLAGIEIEKLDSYQFA